MDDPGIHSRDILILGGLGYFGSRLSDRWAAKNRVVATCRSDIESRNRWAKQRGIHVVKTADGLSPNLPGGFEPDLVVNLATPGAAECAADLGSSLRSALANLDWCLESLKRRKKSHLIHFSTFHVYGGIRATYREDDPPAPQSPYGKVHWELESQLAARTNGMPVTVVRPGNLVGKPAHGHLGPQSSLLVLDLCDQSSRGRITLKNDGNSYRDFLSFENAFSALEIISKLDRKNFNLFNLSSGKSIPIKFIVEVIIECRKTRHLPIEVNFGTGVDPYRSPFTIDNTRLAELGWVNQNDLARTIAHVSRFFEENQS